MSDLARDPMVDEKIQMHADKLYKEQYRKEKEMEENAKAGRPLDTPTTEGGESPPS
jgi:hypothetical protein